MADATLPEDFDDQQKLAESYRPDLSGPNVSARLPITQLVERYANGAQAYQDKTKSLAESYASLRRVKGDRKCGWRAICFVYCETLIELHNPALVDAEKKRVFEMCQQMDVLGETHKGLFEDMCLEATHELLDRLKVWMDLPKATDELQAFFETDEAAHVLYGFRLIAGLGLRTNEEISLFLEQPVEDYCNNVLFLPDEEIDETGLRALNDTLLLPAGLSLEVVNLHSNSGSEADIINYPAPAQPALGGVYEAQNPPAVRLLFTPGHYDIIYKL